MKTITLTFVSAFAGTALLASAPNALADAPTITVIPSLAPNVFGSPSFTDYQSNAISAIETGQTTAGTGAAQYNALPDGATLNVTQNVVTNFNSWNGVADPNTPQYPNEVGNRLHFGLHIVGNGTQFSISQLKFSATSSDAGNSLGFGFPNGYTYGDGYVGLNYGPDGIKGTSDDFFTTSSTPDTQLVDELFSRGSGNAWEALSSDPGATNQDKIYGTWAKYNLPDSFTFTGTYSLANADTSLPDIATGSAGVNFVPEPASLSLLGLGGLALLGRPRRKAVVR